MTVMIGHATSDESKKLKNGKAGDQTGNEVCIRAWYNRPWDVVIRFKDAAMREKAAYAMERACNNPHIGYDQNQRNTLYNLAKAVKWDPGAVKTNCETDCSALVGVCCIYAGIPADVIYKSGNSCTTANLKARLRSTGKVDVFTSKKYTKSSDELIRGDILLYEGHHTAIVVQGHEQQAQTQVSNHCLSASFIASIKKSVEEIAKEVIAGKWGTGNNRRQKLEAAGYNYSEVQNKVNALLVGRK